MEVFIEDNSKITGNERVLLDFRCSVRKATGPDMQQKYLCLSYILKLRISDSVFHITNKFLYKIIRMSYISILIYLSVNGDALPVLIGVLKKAHMEKMLTIKLLWMLNNTFEHIINNLLL